MSVLSNDVVPGTVFPLESFTVNDAELGTTGSENVTVGSVETGIARRTRDGRALSYRRRRPRVAVSCRR